MSLRDWFRRKPVELPPLDLGGPGVVPQEGFVADWKPGDIGRCVIEGNWFNTWEFAQVPGPARGQIVRVVDVRICRGCACLWVRDWDGWWQAACFVKIDEKGEEKWLGAVRRKHAPKPAKELVE